ncbi:MAG TPA: ATP-binding protein [Opitutaceae bacterium]|nr:ATP-binding protein [Opitutaceae bacterium]
MRGWHTRSLRFMLALWYGAAGTLLLAGFSAALYFYVASRLGRPIDSDLRRDLAGVQEHLRVLPDGQLQWGGRIIPPGAAWDPDNPWFELWDGKHQLVRRLWAFRDERMERLPQAPTPGRETISIFAVAPDVRVQCFSLPFPGPDASNLWMIRVMRLYQPVRGALQALILIILVALPVVVALLVGGGFWVTQRWLAPLESMLAAAEGITADEIERRLPVANPGDELGRLAVAFNHTLDRLQNAFVSLDRFVADASHQLRTPLTALRSVGEVGLRRSRTVEEYREIIGSMLEEARRLQLLVERLLELAAAEGGGSGAPLALVRLDHFVAACVSDWLILADAKGQRIELEVEPCEARIDAVLFRQALQNLVDNAIKYSPSGSSIRVRARSWGSRCEVEVQDQGPGIPPGHADHLTDRFFRLNPGQIQTEGFGLGLAITRAYMRRLGGTVLCREAPGGGSVFQLLLPIARE